VVRAAGTGISVERVAEALAAVRDRIERAGGGPDVLVLPVTKGFGPDAIDAAVAAGYPRVGENYAQELLAKLAEISGPRPEIHFIGQLQTRKVRKLSGIVDVWQTVDRPGLVEELATRAAGAHVMVQVNVTDEPQKAGCTPADAPELVSRARDAGLVVDGLMTIGRAGPPEGSRIGFRELRALADRLGVRHCSMGMSEDLEVAVASGSTMVRVGTAVFGRRPPPLDPPK